MKRADVEDELTSGGAHPFTKGFRNYVYFSIKYLAPIVVAIILIRGLI